jgi:hypothetical protein
MTKENAANASLFFHTNGSVKAPTLFMLGSLPLFWCGRWSWAVTCVFGGLLVALCNAVEDIKATEKQAIRHNIISAHEIYQEIVVIERQLHKAQTAAANPETVAEVEAYARMILETGLAALAKKYGKEVHEKTPKEERNARGLECQAASYVALRMFPNDTAFVAAAVSLLALVAKNERVRERIVQEADEYGFNVPLVCAQRALQRAQDDPTPNQKSEQQSAELQRKNCLLLGALADGDATIASLIVQEGGIEIIMNAAQWYRYHEEVANWALWAIFILCYEYPPTKVVVVEQNGVALILQSMRNNPVKDVFRHGIAILFDLMREPTHANDKAAPQEKVSSVPKLDIWKIRQSALASGLHEIIVRAMCENKDAVDIFMMSQEILVGTNYLGPIPKFERKT